MNQENPFPEVLEGKHVRLLALHEDHFIELCQLAADERIWTHLPIKGQDPDAMVRIIGDAFNLRDSGEQFPFVIQHIASGKLIGTTRYMNIVPQHRQLEIGWTWMHPNYWGTGVNYECKFMLLRFAFEEWNAIRVQLCTDERNLRSRAAILKIGARFEGILRYNRIRENGTFRNSAYFSIICDEWPDIKQMLTGKLKTIQA